jgi:hypothetical protein
VKHTFGARSVTYRPRKHTGFPALRVRVLRAMARFVNYKSRSVALPFGCTDLMDVLRQPSGVCAPLFPEGLPARLEYIMSQLLRLLLSRSPTSSLLLFTEHVALKVFCTSSGGPLEVSLVVEAVPLQQEIRKFFKERSINALQDRPNGSGSRILRYPVSRDALTAAGLIFLLLTGPYRLLPSATLQFLFSF